MTVYGCAAHTWAAGQGVQPRTHGANTGPADFCSAKLGNEKQLPSSVTSTHQRRDIIGPKIGKDITSDTPRPSGWDAPQDNRIRQDRSPEDHTGTYSQPSRDAGIAQTFNYPEAGQQSQTKKLSETLPLSVPPETEVGRKREELRTEACAAPPLRGGSWESWQLDVLPGGSKGDRLLAGRGRQGKGKKERPEQEANKQKIPRPHPF